MKKILLVCAGGMSTSILANKMKAAAKEKGLAIEVDALGVLQCENVIDTVDIVLIGPQVRYQKPQVDELVNGRVPVEVIDMKLYGTMNGKAVLEGVLKTLGI